MKENYIDLIYCDVLYGTGIKFEDYQDLKPVKHDIEEHYIPRFLEMKRVLKDTGSIYIQMDYRISHWVRTILDDIFGYNNFVNEIIWSYSSGGKYKDCYSKKHDNILFYQKGKIKTFNIQKEKTYIPSLKGRTFAIEELHAEYDKEPCIKCGEKGGFYHMTDIRDVWDIKPVNKTEFLKYNTQKPIFLLERIINVSSNKNDIVADFYMGSGTTGEASLKLGRRFIGCDIGDKACKISQERLDKLVTP